jgi:glycosyltransferase involved in cell wall biosynthesis
LTANILVENGFPSSRVTVLNNTIDSNSELLAYKTIGDAELEVERQRFHITANDKIGIFCGSLYRLKRIDFLLEAIQLIKQRYDRFQFFLLGSGEMEDRVTDFARTNGDWFHRIGFVSGYQKRLWLKLADFQMMPGSVGLNIIDSFCAETPIVTIAGADHGPEIDYMQNNENGISTDDELMDYVGCVLSLINDGEMLARLKHGCRRSAVVYTIEKMAANFEIGILKAIRQ